MPTKTWACHPDSGMPPVPSPRIVGAIFAWHAHVFVGMFVAQRTDVAHAHEDVGMPPGFGHATRPPIPSPRIVGAFFA